MGAVRFNEGKDCYFSMESNYDKIFIINSISDYKEVRSEFFDTTNCLFITTHSTIDIFLRSKNEKVAYRSIFDFITEQGAKENLEKSIHDLSRDFNKLDTGIQPELEKYFDAKIELYSAFHYLAILILYSIKNFETTLNNILANYTFDKLVISEKLFNDLLPLDLKLSEIFEEKLRAKNVEYEFRFYSVAKEKHSKLVLLGSILSNKHLFKKAVKKLARLFFPAKKIGTPASGFINVYDHIVNDKKKALAGSNLNGISRAYLKESKDSAPLFDISFQKNFNLLCSSLGQEEYAYRKFLFSYNQLITENAAEFLKKVWLFQTYLKSNKVANGIWDAPPISFDEHPVIFSYLRGKKIPVYGIQHGATYVDQYYPLHQFSDFRNCSHYISYGFDQQNIQAVYPDAVVKLPQVFPFGDIYDKHKNDSSAEEKLSCDLVFPMTNSLGLFDGGDARLLPNTLLKRQYDILQVLNKIKDKKIIVKPFFLNNIHFNYLDHWKKEFKNLQFIDTMTYKEFLKHYHPAGVLIEFPSTPLYETLAVDTDIFLMPDSMIPYSDHALSQLTQRIHYVKDIPDLESILDKWVINELPRKRSNVFYEHYVYKPGAMNAFLDEVSACEKNAVGETIS